MTQRIDTMKNMLAGSRQLLAMLEEELTDLHVLAYDRPAATEEAKVAGGSSEYYLDTHGDKRARDAYRHVGDMVVKVCNLIDYTAQESLKLLREGDTPTQAPRRLRLVELGEQIARQAKRVAAGDYTPARRGPQPDQQRAFAEIIEQRDKAQRDLAKAEKEIARLRRQGAA